MQELHEKFQNLEKKVKEQQETISKLEVELSEAQTRNNATLACAMHLWKRSVSGNTVYMFFEGAESDTPLTALIISNFCCRCACIYRHKYITYTC